MILAPAALSQVLPSVWSKCQWVLIRCVIGSPPRSARALVIWGRETEMPASISTLPSLPVSTATVPPEPSSALMLPRSLRVTIGDVAALSLIRLTMPRASAKAWRGVSHAPAAAVAAPPMQHRQKPRLDRKCWFEAVMANSAFDEREKVGVDGVGLRRRHAVREALVGLQRAD